MNTDLSMLRSDKLIQLIVIMHPHAINHMILNVLVHNSNNAVLFVVESYGKVVWPHETIVQ